MTKFLDTTGVCFLLKISRSTLYKLIEKGLPKIQLIKGGKLLFDPDEVKVWIRKNKIRKIRRLKF